MNIAVFTTHPLFQRHFATELEILQDHLDVGDSAIVLRCAAELLACETNTNHELGICLLCQRSRSIGLSLIETGRGRFEERSFLHLTEADKQELKHLSTSFVSAEELKAFTVENFDIGLAVLSSIVSLVRDLNINVAAKPHNDTIRRYVLSSFAVFRSVQRFLDERMNAGAPIDKFYVFNGRMSITRAIVRACQSRGVTFVVHEIGNDSQTYSLFENNLFHAIDYTTRLIGETWEAAPALERERIAREWLENRASGAMVNGYTFVDKQQRGLLPANWDASKRNVVIFNSADFEYAMVGEEYINHIYPNQVQGIKRLLADVLPYENIHVYLRVHPNLASLPHELAPVMELSSPNLTTIAPQDSVSSYALMAAADRIVVFTSTVGIEAPFWGKPVILAGRANYQNLGATYNPNTHEEVVELLVRDALPPKDSTGSLMYAYFFNTFGQPFKRYKARSFYAGEFNGKEPFASRWLFRLHTLYKMTMPRNLQARIDKRFEVWSLHSLASLSTVKPQVTK
jgi:hypothetical protein